MSANGELRMSDAQFEMFARRLRDHCGLQFGPESRFLLEKRIARRVEDLQLESVSAYSYLLRSTASGPEEMANLVDELTTNETYFFREMGQLRVLIDVIVPELQLRRAAGPRTPIALWSAGCSSGEEAYGLVIMGIEAGLVPGVDFRVYASDISRRALQKARAAVYPESSFRDADPLLREKYFREKNGSWQLSEEIVRHLVFSRVNLLDRARVALLGTLDVVLCRNVIMYLDQASRARVLQSFWEKLRPGGHLLLGHSESLLSVSTSFQVRHVGRELVYRRPGPPGSADLGHAIAEAAASADPPEVGK